MKSALRSFQKYVPADLVAELIRLKKEARLGGEKKELSIFFSDIADFTTIAEQLSPEELSQRLSEYLEVITTEITNLGGTVDKYIGDAVMAFWGAPNELKNHAELAARAALACQAKIAELNQKWKTEGKTPFITRIGISTGAVIVGNFGYAKRLNYTVMGDSVNLASRLEGLNKFYGTDIVISPRTAELCGDRFVMRKIDSVAVKGKKEGVFIFELLSETSQAPDLRFAYLTRFNSALTHYFAQEWQKSEALLNEVLATHAEDGPSKVILKRCHEFAANPPGKDWTGIIFLREK